MKQQGGGVMVVNRRWTLVVGGVCGVVIFERQAGSVI